MNEQIKELKPPEHEKPVAGVRCKIIKNCKSCQHSVGRISCALANKNFDSLERSAMPPDWCPLPFYTSPQAREWVGLTNEDCTALSKTVAVNKYQIRAIEAKLKEKNK